MAYDLEEQEQIDAFKAWWRANGNKVLVVVGVAVACFIGVQAWKSQQANQAVEASARYQELTQTDPADTKTIQGISSELMEKYSATPYAGRAALMAAKANYRAKDIQSAKAQLDWAIKNAKETQVQAIAKLQLATLQYEEKNYDAALETLSGNIDEGFTGLYSDLKGDVLAAQGKTEDAKAAYKEALSKLDGQGKYRTYTQHKLEALGG
ncbi:MAG TPA: tetratricopeptide repeat protein [Methylophilaceae bacterium]|nr:tetratricopeptide repeat protein [Methylophilaceae bacterium]